jgi:hypothetical protein
MRTIVAISDAVIEPTLAAATVTSSIIDYFSHVAAIVFMNGITINSSLIIAMQSSAMHGRAVAERQSAHSAVPAADGRDSCREV